MNNIYKTKYPPNHKPVMVWDGQCGFCAFWIKRWEKMTGAEIDYRPYASAHHDFPDISIQDFRQAVRLIEPNGSVFSGAEAALRSFQYGGRWNWLWPLYVEKKWFRVPSNAIYDWIAKHRSFMQKVTIALFGRNPERLKPFWVIYAIALFLLIAWWIAL